MRDETFNGSNNNNSTLQYLLQNPILIRSEILKFRLRSREQCKRHKRPLTHTCTKHEIKCNFFNKNLETCHQWKGACNMFPTHQWAVCWSRIQVRNWICYIPERAPFLQLQSTENMRQKQIQQRSLDSDKNPVLVHGCWLIALHATNVSMHVCTYARVCATIIIRCCTKWWHDGMWLDMMAGAMVLLEMDFLT